MMSDLARLPRVAIDRDVERLALSAQRKLAEIGHHRLAPTDVIIAACAHVAGAGVLHYDHDYDLLGEHTSLSSKACGSLQQAPCESACPSVGAMSPTQASNSSRR